MPRNIDLTALRSFVTVAEAGGVTRAAGFLNLTQSAVSMQLKRLEEGIGVPLLDRSARAIGLTASGEQLLGYARRMLALNDEALDRLTSARFEGELMLGVPHDVVYPYIPQVLRRFHAEFPRVSVNLISSNTRALLAEFANGTCDAILTTEDACGPGGETLVTDRLVWVGAPGGTAWKSRPLRMAFGNPCIFRDAAMEALNAAGMQWEIAVESPHSRAVEASVSADLAVHALLERTLPPYLEAIPHGGALPDLGVKQINLYVRSVNPAPLVAELAGYIRTAYRGT